MAYDFYIIEGKKLIDYKPKSNHYERAIIQMMQDDICCLEDRDKMKKYIFLNIKKFVSERRDKKKYTYEQLNNRLQFMFNLTDLMGRLTPIEFMQMFPIPKEYDGEKYSVKDYFSTMEEVSKYPQDRPIGYKITEFLMGYYNLDIMEFEVIKLCTISEIRRKQGQLGLMEQFAEDNALHFQTFYKDGNEMVDSETGERFEIVKPKNPLRKLFSVELFRRIVNE